MTQDELKRALLDLSRQVPTRQCSPYGFLQTDDEAIKEIAREAYEMLSRCTQN